MKYFPTDDFLFPEERNKGKTGRKPADGNPFASDNRPSVSNTVPDITVPDAGSFVTLPASTVSDPALDVIFKDRENADPVSTALNWLYSLLIHLLFLFPLLFIYAATSTPKVLEVIAQPGLTEELGMIDVFDDPGDAPELTDVEVAPITVEDVPISEETEVVTIANDDSAAMSNLPSDLGYDPVPVGDLTNPMGKTMGNELEGRGKNKQFLVASGGGSEGSERSVALALAWLAEHQLPSGGWSFDLSNCPNCRGKCRNSGRLGTAQFGATGMALLPFLGAGNTPYEGKYKENVRKGIQFLLKYGVRSQQGLSFMDTGTMYSHGLCTIALCETYTMMPPIARSKMSGLDNACLAALNFIQYAQDPVDGGWRYHPRQRGDTSVVGWQIMALKSGQIGKFKIAPATMQRATNFLVNVTGSNYGTIYGYTSANAGVTSATTSIGLLCRLFLDWKTTEDYLLQGADALLVTGPNLGDPYFNYYATQLFHHIGGDRWKQWNNRMRDPLIAQQSLEGHEKGSWFPRDANGHCSTGGRLYATAMNCMILEVYYRHLPLYQKQSNEKEDFPLD